MKLTLTLNEGDLDNNLTEQIMFHVLRDRYKELDPKAPGYKHPDDKKRDKELRKSIRSILAYYGQGVKPT